MSWLSSRWIMSRLFMSRCLIILVLRLPYILFITLLHTISSARGSRIFKGKMMREVHMYTVDHIFINPLTKKANFLVILMELEL